MTTSSSSDLSFYDETLEESCGCDVGCGQRRKRFPISFLSGLAKAKYALLFLCFASIGQGFLTTGLLSVVITTLERRFHLHSTETGFIASSYDIASLLCVLVITYVGGKGHKPLWIGWGVFIMGFGSLVFAMPHFVAPTYTFGEEQHNTCNSSIIHKKCSPSHLKSYMAFFILGQLLHGSGGTTLFTLGVTYLDENVAQVKSSLYHGVYYASSVVGPALGFLLGGKLLSFYTDINTSVDITEDSSLWIGAWWLGFVVGGIVVMMMAFPILLFPKQLPNTVEVRANRENEMHQDSMAVEVARNAQFGSRLGDVWKSVLVLLRNPTFLLVTIAGSLESGLIFGLTTFGPKYLESMFSITPTQAALYFGLLAILAGATGQLIGGYIVSRAKLSVKGILRYCMACSIFTVCTIFVFFRTCPNIAFAGATVPYHKMHASETALVYSACNMDCNCDTNSFDPVCGNDGITYYSPCFAGCLHVKSRNQGYENCSCIATNQSSAMPDKCSNATCNNLPVFLAVFFFAILGTFLPSTPAIQVILRVVPFTERSFAIGVKFVILRILGTIPGPIIFGKVLDLACLVWSTECGGTGECEIYNNADLASHMASLIAVGKVLVVILFILSYVSYKPPPKTTLDALDEVTLTTTMACSNLGLPTPQGASGGLAELIRPNTKSHAYKTVSYKSLKEDLDTDS